MNVTYIEKWHAWYVTERSGNRVEYHGPFGKKEEAEIERLRLEAVGQQCEG